MFLFGLYFPDIDWYNSKAAILFCTFWTGWTVFVFANIILFLMDYKSFYIRTRSPLLIITSSIGQYGLITILCWKMMIGPDRFSNFVDLLFLWVFIPLHFIPYPVRSVQYILKYHIGVARAKKADDEDYQSKWLSFGLHQKVISDISFFIILVVLLIVCFSVGCVRYLIDTYNQPGHYGTGIQWMSYMFTAISIFVLSVILWITYARVRKINEEFGIAFELRIIGVTWIICVAGFCGFGLASLYCDAVPVQLSIISGIILCIVSFMTSFGYPVSLAHYKEKDYKIEVPVFKTVDSVLDDKKAHQLFRLFLQKALCIEQLIFLEQVRKFKNSGNQQTLEERANYIVDQFIRPGCPQGVNISYQNMNYTIDKLNNVSVDMFDTAYMEVCKLLQLDKLQLFLTTDEAMVNYIHTMIISNNMQEGELVFGEKASDK